MYTGKEAGIKISELIGLTKDQFMQVAMIAQGEFMDMLRKKSDDKKEIFRKLFEGNVIINKICFYEFMFFGYTWGENSNRISHSQIFFYICSSAGNRTVNGSKVIDKLRLVNLYIPDNGSAWLGDNISDNIVFNSSQVSPCTDISA